MAEATNTRKFGSGQVIFRQGEQGGEMYFIQSGEIELEVHNEKTGESAIVGVLSDKAILGTMSFIEEEPRSATAKCRTDVEVVVVNLVHRKRILDSMPVWAKALVKEISRNLRDMNMKYTLLENRAKLLEKQIASFKRKEPEVEPKKKESA